MIHEPYDSRDISKGLVGECELVKYIREQRHDFMNHIQVLWGFLQLNRVDKALKYISNINKRCEILSQAFKLENPALSLFLYTHIKQAYKWEVDVNLEVDVENIDGYASDKICGVLDFLGMLFNEVLLKTEKLKDKTIYIDLYIQDNTFYIVFSNDSSNYPEEEIQSYKTLNSEIYSAIEALKLHGAEVYYRSRGDYVIFKIGIELQEA